jgi:hypothetical protein
VFRGSPFFASVQSALWPLMDDAGGKISPTNCANPDARTDAAILSVLRLWIGHNRVRIRRCGARQRNYRVKSQASSHYRQKSLNGAASIACSASCGGSIDGRANPVPRIAAGIS